MKTWFRNLKIKGKLNLMIGVSLLSLIIFGLTSVYLIKTTKVVNIMLIAQRDYMTDYHKSLEYYYQFKQYQASGIIDRANINLENAKNKITSANDKLRLFSNVELILKKPNSVLIPEICNIYGSAVGAVPGETTTADARLLVNRMRLFSWLNLSAIKTSSEAANTALDLAEQILDVFVESESERITSGTTLTEKLSGILSTMEREETAYAGSVKEISDTTIISLKYTVIILIIILGLLIYLLSLAIGRLITFPISSIRKNLNLMSKGDASGISDYQSRDEIGQLADSYREMQSIMLGQVNHARKVANGDFDSLLEPRSEKDKLSLALNEMTRSLKASRVKSDHDNWIKSNQNEMSFEIQGDLDLDRLSQRIIGLISKQLDALSGALFIFRNKKEVEFAAGFAVNTDQASKRSFKPGDGLIGQAMKDKKPILVKDVPGGYLDIYSGTGSTRPKHLLIVPCIYNSVTEAVLELGSVKPFNPASLEYLNLVAESIAIAMQASKSRTELQNLLEKQEKMTEELQVQQEELRQTNEELQVQQEELRQANEELETQTRELEESKSNLQAQQEELRVTNEELAERSRAIESQKDSLKRKNDELEKARQDIEEKAREIEQVSRYKSEFLANMSHELRTPLNSILVLSQILSQNKDNNLTEKQVKSAQTIKSSGENLLVLISEILDLSKIESGKVELHTENVEISSVVQDLFETFHSMAEVRKLAFETAIDEDIPLHIQTDSLRLGQIMRNLISNAIKFTETGFVKLRVCRPLKPEQLPARFQGRKDLIGFYVEDSGIGVAKEKQKEIFDAFKQADGTTTRKFGGTGLGLAISRNFSRLMGGDILLDSQTGKGSLFILLLPEASSVLKGPGLAIHQIVHENPEAEFKMQEIPAQKQEKVPFSEPAEEMWIEETSVLDDRKEIKKGDTFLLIIEDDNSFAQIVLDLAHEKNFKCMIAPNGETGLHYADYYSPSAIILDIGLPGIDGWEVMKRLQENPATRHIPVHFMSGTDKSLEALKKGAIGFLTKPVTIDEINEAFDRIEGLISKPLKKLLVVEDDAAMRLSIHELIGEENIQIVSVSKGQEAIELLKKESFDAMILDLGLEDMTGYDLLQKIGKRKDSHAMPVIIYTGKELTREEEERLKSYSDRIIIKGIKSPERLLAETTLFLHQVQSNLPEEKQKMLRNLHPKEDVMKDKIVLIVDDDMRNVFAVTSLLEDVGLKIVVGKNGRDGIEKLKNNPVDLILMDIMMPEMNGYEAMEEIRKEMKYRKLPIIALTAKAMPGDREKCLRAGASDYLTKPIDSEKLLSMLRVWLYKG
ncbi:MAG TPA: histidine kinase [Bacteroidales bacterium]|nr:histidine kinase [Bacteroidales bacterium]